MEVHRKPVRNEQMQQLGQELKLQQVLILGLQQLQILVLNLKHLLTQKLTHV